MASDLTQAQVLQNLSNFGYKVPASTAPTTPVPQQTTPSAPSTGFQGVNYGTGSTSAPQGFQGSTQTTPTQPTPQPTSTTTQTNQQTQPAVAPTGIAQQEGIQPLQMPQNGSVVDLLNAAGQYSDFASRQQLAQQFGIQGYTGTAAQNQDLAKKYLDAYNANKSSTVPQSGAEARGKLGSYFQNDQSQLQQNPQQSFFDSYMSMNPVVKQLYDTINQTLSSVGTQQTLTQTYADLIAQSGLPALQTELMNLDNIMNGTEDDIRSEISSVGGIATDSQVKALTAARNKTLLSQANVLQQQIALKNDYVNQIMQLTQADRAEADKEVEQKLNLTGQLANIQTQMINAAKDNYNSIIQAVGYQGLAQSLQTPQQISQAESILGMAPGELQSLANYTPPMSQKEQLQIQNMQLQNEKLFQDINAPASGSKLQFISGTANQPGGVFNPVTGVFTPTAGTADNTMKLANVQQNVSGIQSLLDDPSLKTAVGPNALSRDLSLGGIANLFTAGKSNFIAGVQQVQQSLTLQNLQNAKANGATFGALSEGELNLLSQSASKLGSWAVKDGNGNIVGYNTTETNFKKELDTINNFSKLDYILKGGDPSSVGVQQMADGTFWTENSDGSKTQLK